MRSRHQRADVQTLAHMVGHGLTVSQIAAEIGAPERTVRGWLYETGLKPRRGLPGGEIGSRKSKADTPIGPLTVERLKSLLWFDEGAGVFCRVRTRGRMNAGAPAGALNGRGYVSVGVDGRTYAAHRLVYFYRSGAWPDRQVDHINGDRTDNRPCNLRLATPQENVQNKRAKGFGESGLLGAAKGRNGKFTSSIVHGGKRHYLGEFGTAYEAHMAHIDAKRRLHPFNTL